MRPAGRVVALPSPSTRGTVSVEQALAARRSVRTFTPQPLTEHQVAQLLWAAQGENRPGRRTAPSAGALYPVTAYAVRGDEVLQYLPAGHRARVWEQPGCSATWPGPRAATLPCCSARRPCSSSPSPRPGPGRSTAAGGRATPTSRRPRYADLEAGHAAENVLLQAVALGLGAVVVGGFDDAAVARALTLPGGEEPRYLVPVGHPAGSP